MFTFNPKTRHKKHSHGKPHHHHSRHHNGRHHHGRHHNSLATRGRDREREMIINRLVLIVITLSISLFLDATQPIMLGLKLHLMASLTIYIAYRLEPGPSNPRRLAGLVTDFGVATYLFDIGGSAVAALYPLYLWVILGYGFRFGIKWLAVAAAMGTLSFGWTVYSVPFWQQNLSLSLGLLFGLIIIPAYCSTLIIKISKATKEAEEANKAKSLFLASISHELRTPLNAIIGYGTHLLDMNLPEAQQKMVSTSVSAGQHLLHLINQLLSFARSDTQEELPEPKTFSIVDVLTEVRDIMQLAADEKALTIHLQAEAMSDQLVSGQLEYIRNILINLTSNAVKFTETGSITLKCGIDTDADVPLLWCSVTDTGPGIAADAHDKIFGVFQQADETIIDNFGGTGLGLAICQQLAIQMDGHVSLDSTLGEGSTFMLSCPIEIIKAVQNAADSDNLKILSLGFGQNGPEISGSDAGDVEVDHIQCLTDDKLEVILEKRALHSYDLALLDDMIAEQQRDNSALWDIFQEANLPPVLLSNDSSKSLDEIKLRAAFASVLPASPDFDAVRSVVQIGCSFNRTNNNEEDDPDRIIRNDVSLDILIADDNRTNQMVLQTILVNAGHKVVAVSDGELALDELEKYSFDIVFLDVNMPNIDGIECCKLWRQIEGPRNHVPIIGLTADSTPETEKKCLDAGMDLRLTKPIEAGVLLDTVAEQTGNFLEANTAQAMSDTNDPFNVVRNIGTKATNQSEPPIDGVQMDYLKSIGDEVFIQSIIDAYIEDTQEIMLLFEQSVKQSNVDDFRFQAHAFKSGANNVGANKLAQMCGVLEVITEAEFTEKRFVYLDEIKTELSRITDFLSKPSPRHTRVADSGFSAAG
ncbi:response regulator [Parasphingorhabdus cellanae]|uniref:histidine kinase n=1 Tax=Parasphingorhabdus cellanae TaxID=2806553 RepID=A0ABX7T5I5_9SPHN|nr:response regulator [Parasphingorhabdus cellanae]QTD56032.1 response regulator [Parasphingorhabdus cellanae]